MTHNKFNIETDLVMPLTKFLQQIRLDLSVTTPTPHLMSTKHSKSKSMQFPLLGSPTSKLTRSNSSTRDLLKHKKFSNGFSDKLEVYSNLTSQKENRRRNNSKQRNKLNPILITSDGESTRSTECQSQTSRFNFSDLAA